MPPPVRRQLTAAQARRRADVVRLRAEGLHWAEIGARLGISDVRAGQIYRDALRAWPAAEVDEHRAQLLREGDEAVQELRRIIADPTISARTKVEAIATWCRWSDRLGRLTGADAPARHALQVITADVIEAEIARLEDEQRRRELTTGVTLDEADL
jgi:hypothetical protein